MHTNPLVVVLAALSLFGCEPAFIDQCAKECDCTRDSFACREPKSGGCDNAWRREWTLASMDDCGGQYVAWFDCVHANSTCSTDTNGAKTYGAPDSACEAQASALRACCSDGKCDG